MQFCFSTSVDGKVRAWMYENQTFHVEYDTPGKCSTKMLYSSDGTRLFSCGTSKDGESFLVEWDEPEGAIKRTYSGFGKKSVGMVQFDSTKSRFLAAGEDNQVKFWDMDVVNVLASTDAEGGLPNLPRLKFNKEGNLLAVSTADGGFKVLANADGIKFLRNIEASKEPFFTKSPGGLVSIGRGRDININSDEGSKSWELTEIVHPVQCRIVTVPEGMGSNNKVACLVYTNSGNGLLALGSKGVQKLWKWSFSELNPTGKATASVVPQHWRPSNGILMTNDVPSDCEMAVPCIALSRNDSYAMAACGGNISLFNMVSFKVLFHFLPPPPVSTCVVFSPQDNNVVAVGRADSNIQIFNVRLYQARSLLKGHQKYITGIVFSLRLNIMVSSGADAQIFSWNMDTWNKKKSVPIKLPSGENAPAGETKLEFHIDQIKLLACHETQLAIYDASKLELICRWVPQDVLPGAITSAVYSCNGRLVYATFTDGNVGVFDAETLKPRCRIASSAYIHQSQTPSNSQNVYPVVVAAHPHEPNQFAIGLSDGSIKVIEPPETEGWQGIKVPVVNNGN
ncbi:topless-related protein 2-like [Cicer arietinum]|uniref:topless-related protein 2-like n=1 Tax=Cicer arietinum TaxID=3827 RepID=UPI003CC59C13